MRCTWLVGASMAVSAVLATSPAFACSCFGFSTLEAAARSAPFVVVGRVAVIGDRREGDPMWLTLEGIDAVKGAVQPTLRVWNTWAGTSCGGALANLPVGTTVVMALDRVGTFSAERRESWDLLNMHPPDEDLMLGTTCGEWVRELTSARDQKRWRARRLK